MSSDLTSQAVYENGVFVPVEPVTQLADRQAVKLIIHLPDYVNLETLIEEFGAEAVIVTED